MFRAYGVISFTYIGACLHTWYRWLLIRGLIWLTSTHGVTSLYDRPWLMEFLSYVWLTLMYETIILGMTDHSIWNYLLVHEWPQFMNDRTFWTWFAWWTEYVYTCLLTRPGYELNDWPDYRTGIGLYCMLDRNDGLGLILDNWPDYYTWT